MQNRVAVAVSVPKHKPVETKARDKNNTQLTAYLSLIQIYTCLLKLPRKQEV
jgi:hypothetical protein